MANKSGRTGYAGKIANAGTQVVQAPMQKTKGKNGTVKTGTDLRSGKKTRKG